MSVICTQDDELFNEYKEKVSNRKVIFHIKDIFIDHWNNFLNKFPNFNIRQTVFDNVKRMIKCKTLDLGFDVFKCPDCGKEKICFHTCKSRLCSSCGYKYKIQRVNSILQTAYNCPHRQIVFTIPTQLRKYFFFPLGSRIDILFKAVRDTIYSILNFSFKRNKKGILKKYSSKILFTPGFFSFLHTFGRDLKWNPHIHILLAEIKIGDDNSCTKWNFFDYNALSLRFQKILLDLLSKELGNSFDIEKKKLYSSYKKGFYVYAEPKKFKNLKDGIEYVARYCGRPPISENRIINYDGSTVTFSYTDHKDNSYHKLSVTAFDFIIMILRHLLPNQFKIIRYYGFYRKKSAIHPKMIPIIKEHAKKFKNDLSHYRNSILISFNRDPYDCPKCGKRLIFSVFLN